MKRELEHTKVCQIRPNTSLVNNNLGPFYMELPCTLASLSHPFMEQFEQNKLQCPLDEAKLSIHPSFKQKRGKKAKSDNPQEKPRSRKVVEPGRQTGHWNPQEKRKYHWFLEIYHNHFEHKHMRRMDKIFKTMADFLGTRAADQCRSHHQKMQKKYKNFYNIIYNLRLNHYSTPAVSELSSELSNIGLSLVDGLISQNQLEVYVHQKEVEQQARQPPSVPEKHSLELNSPKWNSDFGKYNIDKPLELFMDLSNQQFDLI